METNEMNFLSNGAASWTIHTYVAQQMKSIEIGHTNFIGHKNLMFRLIFML